MLKKTLLMTMSALTLSAELAVASNASQAGIGGAAGGAIIGQAIGRNTESTLLGTAIGGVLGYMIGNEMDKPSMTTTNAVYYPTQAPAPRYLPPEPECREVEVLATINGRAERVYSTACFNGRDWVLEGNDGRVSRQTVVIERDRYIAPTRVVYYHAPHRHHRDSHHEKRHYRDSHRTGKYRD